MKRPPWEPHLKRVEMALFAMVAIVVVFADHQVNMKPKKTDKRAMRMVRQTIISALKNLKISTTRRLFIARYMMLYKIWLLLFCSVA